MLPRPDLLIALQQALARAPVVALLGPRQCGMTTLARELVDSASVNYFDLEDPISLARLDEPLTTLQVLCGTVVIDEVQRRPELFPLLRVLALTAGVQGRLQLVLRPLSWRRSNQ